MTVWLSVCYHNQDVPRAGRVHVLIFKCPIFQPAVKCEKRKEAIHCWLASIHVCSLRGCLPFDVRYGERQGCAEPLAIDLSVCDVVCWVSSGLHYKKVKPVICRHEAESSQCLTSAEVKFLGFISSYCLDFQGFFAERLLNIFRRIL